jgi:hypothetical protein
MLLSRFSAARIRLAEYLLARHLSGTWLARGSKVPVRDAERSFGPTDHVDSLDGEDFFKLIQRASCLDLRTDNCPAVRVQNMGP